MFGVAVGAMAHFGRIISENGWPTSREVVGFVMQLGFVALVAALLTEQMQVSSELMRSVTASILTVAANETLRWAQGKARWLLGNMTTPTPPSE